MRKVSTLVVLVTLACHITFLFNRDTGSRVLLSNSSLTTILLFILDSIITLPKEELVDVQSQQNGDHDRRRKLDVYDSWALDSVNAEQVPDDSSWNRKLCLIGTGYRRNHEDLPDDPKIVTGKSFHFESGYYWMNDNRGWGTAIGGMIAAIGGNDKGLKGVIRNGQLKLHIAQAWDSSGSSSVSGFVAAIDDCADQGANVIHIDLFMSQRYRSLEDAINAAYAKGILIFAPSGSADNANCAYPACYEHVTSVAAMSSNYQKIRSNYNDEVDMTGPGQNVITTYANGYDSYGVTSHPRYGSAFAAGVAALVWSNFPTFPAEQLLETLKATAMELPRPSLQQCKYY